jgi:hypothetical protein
MPLGTRRRSHGVSRAVGRAGTVLVCATLAAALPIVAYKSMAASLHARALRRLSIEERRELVFGAPYEAAVAEIRKQVPPEDTYAIWEAGSARPGDAYWIRFDLAPRKPVLLDAFPSRGRASSPTRLRRVRWLVVVNGSAPPSFFFLPRREKPRRLEP